jgi:hypothetical protein
MHSVVELGVQGLHLGLFPVQRRPVSAWAMNPSILPPSMSAREASVSWGPPKFLSLAL